MSVIAVFKPAQLARYREIAGLLLKYGGRELLDQLGIHGRFGAPTTEDQVRADAEELASDLEAMGPTFVKLGQVLSSRADMLPLPYLKALSRLQDHVAALDYETVEQVFEEEFSVKPDEAFARFDREPLAAASLGQVHRAALHDGREVVVKVQRPGVRESMADDLDVLSRLAKLIDEHTAFGSRYQFHEIVRQFRKNLTRELDYTLEADNLQTIGENLHRFERIIVPRPIESLVTTRVLTMQYVDGVKVTDLRAQQADDIDGLGLTDTLFHAYLVQILDDGVFHADPHPGNIMLIHDGRIALLDLGMVGYVGERMQEHLLNLLIAVSDGREDDAAEVAVTMGQRTEHFEPDDFRREISEVIVTYYSGRVERMEIGRLVLEVCRVAGGCGLRIPPELMMLGKALLNLDQIGRVLAPQFDANAAIRKRAGALMRHRMFKTLSPGQMFTNLIDLKNVVEKMPTRISRVLDLLADNNLKMRVDAIDENRLINGLEKIANRVTVGLVLAALILGAALMMRIDTTFKIFDYPGVAIILFIIAGGVGTVFVAGTLWTDLTERKRKR